MKRHGGLGAALAGQGHGRSNVEAVLAAAHRPGAGLREVAITALRRSPWQPRADLGDLSDLAENIAAVGVLEPLLARVLPGGDLELLAGERRLEGAKLAGLTTVPVRILDIPDDATAAAVALAENVAREGLSAMAEATALAQLRKRLKEAGEPHDTRSLARLVGFSVGKTSERLKVAERITAPVVKRAGIDVHTVNTLPATALEAAADQDDRDTRAAMLAQAATGAMPSWYEPPRKGRQERPGRPPAPYSLRMPADGKITFLVRDPAALDGTAARDIITRLGGWLDALRERVGEGDGK